VAKLKPSAGGDAWGFSSFHDEEVALSSLESAFKAKGVSHLDVPAGKYVVFAKVDTFSETYDDLGFVSCALVAGVDWDKSSARGDSNLALTVVHNFAKPGRIALRCSGLGSTLIFVKITAVRVAFLKNVYVEAG
jgi:hypothetical protein